MSACAGERDEERTNERRSMRPATARQVSRGDDPEIARVESVITSGIFSTLNIYNTLIIGRLILMWFPNPPRQIIPAATRPY